jgi:RecB family exonuclease
MLEKRLLWGKDSGRAEYAERIPAEELDRVRLFCERLVAIRERSTEGGLEALVERAATAFGYDVATLARPDGRQRWANVRKLMRLAREFEADEGPDLAAFVGYLDDRAARDDREGEAATEAEGHDGVRVMTVHAAKGLEFPIVAVAHLGRDILAGFPPAVRVAPGGPAEEGPERFRIGVRLSRMGRPSEYLYEHDALKERAEALDSAEAMRLAYVAATRAQRRLLLSGTVTDRQLSGETKLGTPVAARLARAWLEGELDADEPVELPAPSPRRGLDASFAPARVRVQVSEPGPGAGAELLTSSEAPAALPPPITGAPPLLDSAGRVPAASGRLSYSALSDYKRCGYRFYVERVLGIRTRDPAPAMAEIADERPGAGDPPTDELPGPDDVESDDEATPAARARRYALGNAVHGLLEWSAGNRWMAPTEDRVLDALRREGIAPTEPKVERATGLVKKWLDSELAGELEGAKLLPEAPFVLALGPSLVRGSIDLLAERPDGSLLVIDYKTDRLGGTAPAEHMERYEVQRKLYAVAASLRADAPVTTIYCFLERPDDPQADDYGPVEIAALRVELEALVAELETGDFQVTPAPHRALCHDCPAGPRLCSYDRDARDRRDPVPVAG